MPKVMGMPTKKLSIKDSVRQKTAYWTPIQQDDEDVVLISREVDDATYQEIRDLVAARLGGGEVLKPAELAAKVKLIKDLASDLDYEKVNFAMTVEGIIQHALALLGHERRLRSSNRRTS